MGLPGSTWRMPGIFLRVPVPLNSKDPGIPDCIAQAVPTSKFSIIFFFLNNNHEIIIFEIMARLTDSRAISPCSVRSMLPRIPLI